MNNQLTIMTSLLATTSLIPATSATVEAAWNYPTYFLLIAIALVLIADLFNQYIESKKIICLVTDFTNWSYRDIQLLAIANGIRGNQKKVRLIQLLQEV